MRIYRLLGRRVKCHFTVINVTHLSSDVHVLSSRILIWIRFYVLKPHDNRGLRSVVRTWHATKSYYVNRSLRDTEKILGLCSYERCSRDCLQKRNLIQVRRQSARREWPGNFKNIHGVRTFCDIRHVRPCNTTETKPKPF